MAPERDDPQKFAVPAAVAVLIPSQNDKLFSIKVEKRFNLHYLEPEDSNNLDLIAYVDQTCEYLRKNEIKSVLALNDLAAVVLSGVAMDMKSKFGIEISAPSMESSLACMHKLLTREVLDPDPIWFQGVPLDKLRNMDEDSFPFFVKPTTTSSSEGTFPVSNRAELIKAVNYLDKKLPEVCGFLHPFMKKYCDLSDKELERIDPGKVVLCEQLMKGSMICFVDGTIDSQGKIIIWLVGDNNYYERSKFIFSDCSVPSRMVKDNPELVSKLKEQFTLIGNKLIKLGYKSFGFGLEFFVSFDKDGKFDVKLLEINGRMSIAMGEVYEEVYGINLHEMQIQLSLGKSLDQLEMQNKARLEDPGLVGSLTFITILIGAKDDGISTDELVDFEAANKIIKSGTVDLRMKVSPGIKLGKSCSSGTKIAMLSLYLATRDDNMAKTLEIQNKILKRPELAPTHPDFKLV